MNIKNGRKLLLLIAVTFFLISFFKLGNRLYSAVIHYKSLNKNLPALAPVYTKITEIKFPEKIWIHRVNSIQRAVILAQKHKGLELDIMYDHLKKYFDVGHPPTPSIGLSLDSFFASIPKLKNHYFWLDYKNLSILNKDSSCALLVSMINKYNLSGHIIVESSQPEALSIFTKKGFYTSYLIPNLNLDSCNNSDIDKEYGIVKYHLIHSEVNAISSQSKTFPFIEKYFPTQDVLLWHLDDRKGVEYYLSVGYLNLKKNVKVVLVNEESEGYR